MCTPVAQRGCRGKEAAGGHTSKLIAGQGCEHLNTCSSRSCSRDCCLLPLQQHPPEAAPENWPSLVGPAEAPTEVAAAAPAAAPPAWQPLSPGGTSRPALGGAAAASDTPPGRTAGTRFSHVAACQSPAMHECVGTLLLMGFPEEAAVAAAQAAGGEVEAAAALILEQQSAGMWQQHEPAADVPG